MQASRRLLGRQCLALLAFISLIPLCGCNENDVSRTASAATPRARHTPDSDELREAFTKHIDQTEGHVERLEEVFGMIDKKTQGQDLPSHYGNNR